MRAPILVAILFAMWAYPLASGASLPFLAGGTEPGDVPPEIPVFNGMEVWRTRAVTPLADVLQEAALVPDLEVSLNLFDDASYSASHSISMMMGDYEMWAGTINDAAVTGSAVFAIAPDGDITGLIRHDYKTFIITTSPESPDTHLLLQVSHEEHGECTNEDLGIEPVPQQAPAPPSPDWAGEIKVKLVLSPEAVAISSSPLKAEAISIAALMEANLAFKNGNVDVIYVLESVEIDTTPEPSTMVEQLSYIKGSKHATSFRRDADLVAYITGENVSLDGCGAAPYGPDPEKFYSVSRMPCIISGYTLIHELGHNMGADHDKFVVFGDLNYISSDYNFGAFGHTIEICPVPEYETPPANPPFPTSCQGVRFSFARSVMSYSNYCNSIGKRCPPVLTFSRRDWIGSPNENNTWVHARSAPIVSAFR